MKHGEPALKLLCEQRNSLYLIPQLHAYSADKTNIDNKFDHFPSTQRNLQFVLMDIWRILFPIIGEQTLFSIRYGMPIKNGHVLDYKMIVNVF